MNELNERLLKELPDFKNKGEQFLAKEITKTDQADLVSMPKEMVSLLLLDSVFPVVSFHKKNFSSFMIWL